MDDQKTLTAFDLNLEPIVIKSLDADEGYGWDLEFALDVAAEYRRFLQMCCENPDKPIVPSSLVDEFWHLHILDTRKYQQDCENVFGEFLHHFPYFGMRDEADAERLTIAWEDTKVLYKDTFGEKPRADLWLGSKRCPNCGVRCKMSDFGKFEERPSFKSMELV